MKSKSIISRIKRFEEEHGREPLLHVSSDTVESIDRQKIESFLGYTVVIDDTLKLNEVNLR